MVGVQGGPGFVRGLMVLAAGLIAVLLLMAPPRSRSTVSEAGTIASEPVPTDADVALTPVGLDSLRGVVLPQYTNPSITGLGPRQGPAPTATPTPTPTPVVPRTTNIVNVYIGPGTGYQVIGLLPRSAKLEVIGRDDSGAWLAIVFSVGSRLTGWIPVTTVSGLDDVSALAPAEVTLIEAPTATPGPARPARVTPTPVPRRR